jgi:large subunit ribosomal protein L21
MFAVIETGGKQYKVALEDKVRVEKIEAQEGDAVIFDKVLLISDEGTVEIGKPVVEGAKVTGTVLEQGRDKKKIVFRFHNKTRYRKKNGHRQPFTEVTITGITK